MTDYEKVQVGKEHLLFNIRSALLALHELTVCTAEHVGLRLTTC